MYIGPTHSSEINYAGYDMSMYGNGLSLRRSAE